MSNSVQKSVNPVWVILSLATLFFFAFLSLSAWIFWKKAEGGDFESEGKTALFDRKKGGIGLLEVKGVIMDSKKTLKLLRRFEEDDRIKAVVVRLNSPGGSVGPSQEIYEALKNFPKPVVASMGSVAASGAFYIAMGAKKVYANAGTLTGSIGVIMQFANLKKLYDWAKVERYALTTGRYKDSGSDYREMAPDERALLQGLIDEVLGQFKAAVVEGRGLSLEAVSAVADGRVIAGSQAKKLKLVDELGSLDDAIEAAGKLAKIEGRPRILTPERKKTHILEMLMDRGGDEDDDTLGEETHVPSSRDPFGLGQLLNQIAPHVALPPGMYVLWTAGR